MTSAKTTTAGIVAILGTAVLVAGEVLHWGLSDELRALLLGAVATALGSGLLMARDDSQTSEGTAARTRRSTAPVPGPDRTDGGGPEVDP